MAGPLRMQLDARLNRKPQHQFDASPLVDRSLTIRNRFGEERFLSGKVPLGVNAIDEIKIIISQNGGTCEVKPGTGDLSELMWITSISLSDGFTVKDWLQIRNRDNDFGRSKVIGSKTSFWDNAETLRVKGDGNRTITEDFGETRELPTFGDEPKGCGGSMNMGELKAIIAAKYGAETETVWVNPDTGQIKKEGELPKDDFKLITLPAPNDPVVSYALKSDIGKSTAGFSGLTTGAIFQMVFHSQAFEEAYYNQTPTQVQITIPPEQPVSVGSALTQAKTTHLKVEHQIFTRLLMDPTERRLWGRLYGLPDDESSLVVLQSIVLQSTQLMQAQPATPMQRNQDVATPIQQAGQLKPPTLAFSAFNAQPDVRSDSSIPDAVTRKQELPVQLPAQMPKIQKTEESLQMPKTRRKRTQTREQQKPYNQPRTRQCRKTENQSSSVGQNQKPNTRKTPKHVEAAKIIPTAKARQKTNRRKLEASVTDVGARHRDKTHDRKTRGRHSRISPNNHTDPLNSHSISNSKKHTINPKKAVNEARPLSETTRKSASFASLSKDKRRSRKNEFSRYFLFETLGLYPSHSSSRYRKRKFTGRTVAGSL